MKVFISHSHIDKQFALSFSELLVRIGYSTNDIFCSSIEGQNVNSEEINNRIKDELAKSDLAILLLSESYLESSFCMNEMGAIWILERVKKVPFYSLKLPNVSFEELKGFINSNTKQYVIELKSMKVLIEELSIKIDKKMSNIDIDNAAENFIDSSLNLIGPSTKVPIEINIKKDNWIFMPNEKYKTEELFDLDKNIFKSGDNFKVTIPFKLYQKDIIKGMNIYLFDDYKQKNLYHIHSQSIHYYYDDKTRAIMMFRTERKKLLIQIW